MSQFIMKNDVKRYPVINSKTGWHQQYYFSNLIRGHPIQIKQLTPEQWADSVLAMPQANRPEGFWMAGAHLEPVMKSLGDRLDSIYVRVKEREFHDAWAQLYISKRKADSSFIFLNAGDFPGAPTFDSGKLVAIWNGAIQSKEMQLNPGVYKISIQAFGQKGNAVFPLMSIRLGNMKVGEYYLTEQTEEKVFTATLYQLNNYALKLELLNDYSDPSKGDRNIFIKQVILSRESPLQ